MKMPSAGRVKLNAVQARDRAVSAAGEPLGLSEPSGRGRLWLWGGGTAGNEQLTALTGVILIVLLAVIGVTILRIRQLISVHLFVGLLLMGPLALKLASTGYRFVRYYASDPAYRDKGPPELAMRAIAPLLVVSTVTVMVTGVLLLFGGASSRDQYLEIHKVSFIVWVAFAALHVLGHLPALPRSLRVARTGGEGTESIMRSPGEAGRWLALAGALVAGAVLAVALIPDFGSWTAHAAAVHHHARD